MNVTLKNNLRFEDAHRISSDIEKAVRAIVPNARITVQTKSSDSNREQVWKLVKEVAESVAGSRGVHNIHLQTVGGKVFVDFHLEVSANMTVKEAHSVSEEIEKKLRTADPGIGEITIHMESASDLVARERSGAGSAIKWYVEDLASRFEEIKGVHGIRVRNFGDRIHIELQCRFDPNIDMKRAHEITSMMENEIKATYPDVSRIDIHEEPA